MSALRRTVAVVLCALLSLTVGTLPAAAVDVGPVSPWRWGVPHLCLENHSSFPMQTHAGEWNKANDLILQYEGCAGWGNWERIDVYETYNPARADTCTYLYRVLEEDQTVRRMILYLNTAATTCWSGPVRKNHFTSGGIGTALGLRVFNTYPPYYVSVMRGGSYDTVSYAQQGDRTTFDWYNNLCPPVCGS